MSLKTPPGCEHPTYCFGRRDPLLAPLGETVGSRETAKPVGMRIGYRVSVKRAAPGYEAAKVGLKRSAS